MQTADQPKSYTNNMHLRHAFAERLSRIVVAAAGKLVTMIIVVSRCLSSLVQSAKKNSRRTETK